MLLQRWSLALPGLRSVLILQHVWAFECWTTTEIIITMSAEREYLYMKEQKFAAFLFFLSHFFYRRFIEFTTNTKNRNSSLKKNLLWVWSRAARWFYFWSLPSTFSYTQYIIIFIRKFQSIHWIFIIIHHPSTLIFIVYGWSDHTRNMKAADRTTKRRKEVEQ